VAYYKLHKKMPGVYESCATRKFHHGRTETIRSLTPDSHALARCLVDGEAGDKLALLQKAAATHSQVSKDASNGMGCVSCLRDGCDAGGRWLKRCPSVCLALFWTPVP
jgi:carnitine O-acetyltransferase